jgi:hypothetical protein
VRTHAQTRPHKQTLTAPQDDERPGSYKVQGLERLLRWPQGGLEISMPSPGVIFAELEVEKLLRNVFGST